MHVEVKDPDEKIILSRIYSAEGESPGVFIAILSIMLTISLFSSIFDQVAFRLHRTHRASM